MPMKRLSATVLWVFSLAPLSFSGSALAKETLMCPATLRVSGAALQSPDLPEGAEMAFKAGPPLPLSSLGVFSGHPRDMASLVPDRDREEQASGVTQSVWKFDDPDPFGTYLVCEYGDAGKVQVYKRVSDAARSCTATARNDRARHAIVDAAFACE